MRFRSLTLAALSAVAVSAQFDSVELSILAVVKTIIPADALSRAIANPSAFSAEIASSLAAGHTPPWYEALPTDVKSYLPLLYPAPTAASTTASITPVPYPTPVPSTTPLTTPPPVTTTASISGTTAIPGNSTVISTVSSATLKTTSEPPLQTGAAPRIGAILGVGLAGALGVVGMLL